MICAKNPGRWLEVRNLKKPNLDKVTTFAGCLRFFEWVFFSCFKLVSSYMFVSAKVQNHNPEDHV